MKKCEKQNFVLRWWIGWCERAEKTKESRRPFQVAYH